jgi:elongation factor P
MASTADFRNGMVLQIDGDLFSLTYFQHVKPGKGGAFVRTKLKNVMTGAVTEKTFRAGEKVDEVRLVRYLKENMMCEALTRDDQPLSVELPFFVELEVTETEPGVRGDTAQGGTKPAKLETGAVVQVPLFVEIGDVIKVDRRENKYLERVSS